MKGQGEEGQGEEGEREGGRIYINIDCVCSKCTCAHKCDEGEREGGSRVYIDCLPVFW